MKNRYHKDIGSFQNQFCPTAEELSHYKFETADSTERTRIFIHLQKCRVCRELFKTISKIDPSRQEHKRPEVQDAFAQSILKRLRNEKPTPQPMPLKPAPGQIWSTKPEENAGIGVPVLIVSAPSSEDPIKLFRVIPISMDTSFIHPPESGVLKSKNNPLGVDLLLPFFNERPVLVSSFIRLLGSLSPQSLQQTFDAREKFWVDESEMVKPTAEYLDWKEQEIAMTDYLIFPVNRATSSAEPYDEELYEDTASPIVITTKDGIIIIDKIKLELQPYQVAAQDQDISLSEIKLLAESSFENFKMLVLQIRDIITLRVICAQDYILEKAIVKGRQRKINAIDNTPGVYEVALGNLKKLPSEHPVTLVINAITYKFTFAIQQIRRT
ncbi:uncharacterized protein Dvar_51730 [Desulfosarcina variabilis str. Montpellier]|uniref:hypothetical protein n=1 Tax=Desulfosarcina variabilis TaxID=2300 RepID=UPI003AFA0908